MGYADAERKRAEMLEWWAKPGNMREFKERMGGSVPIGEAFFIEMAAEIGFFGDGDTYSVHPSIVGMVAEAAKTIPDLTIRPEMFKSFCAFVWLEAPYRQQLFVPKHGETFSVALNAISWQYVNMRKMSDERTPYSHAHPDTAEEATGLTITYWCLPQWASVPVPAAWGTLYWGENWARAKERFEREDRFVRGTDDEEAMDDNFHNFLLSLLSFIESEVLITERHAVENRGTRKRIERATKRKPREIMVVKLRRRSQGETDEQERREIEWGCQWMVSGHWRQQACGPQRSQRRAIWIKPYRKGDPAKPFNEKARRVYEVVR